MQFTYQARDDSGHVRTGELAAATAADAAIALRQEGLYLLNLDEMLSNEAV